MMAHQPIDRCTKEDYNEIIASLADFFGSDGTKPFHHPMFIYEFGDSAYVIRKDRKVAAYLL